MDANQKLTQFMEAVSRSTDAQIAQAEQEAEREAAQLLAEADERCRADAARTVAEAKSRITAKYQKKMSQVGYRGRTAFLSRRQTLLMQLFADLREKLRGFTESEDYLPWLKKLLELHPPQDGSVILLREKDMPMQGELRAALSADCSFRTDPAIVIGGLSVLSPDGRRCENHSLDEAFSAQLRNFYRNHKLDGGDE